MNVVKYLVFGVIFVVSVAQQVRANDVAKLVAAQISTRAPGIADVGLAAIKAEIRPSTSAAPHIQLSGPTQGIVAPSKESTHANQQPNNVDLNLSKTIPAGLATTIADSLAAGGKALFSTLAPISAGSTNGATTPHASITTTRPHVIQVTSSKPTVRVTSTAAPEVKNNGHSTAPLVSQTSARFEKFFEPLCHAGDKISLKKMFKVQSNLKQFVEKTAGKLSLCFMDHYGFIPSLNPVTKEQLARICSSKDGKGKGSLTEFGQCANRNTDPSLDEALDQIISARAKKHHGLNSLNDDDENEAPAQSNNPAQTVGNKTVSSTTIKPAGQVVKEAVELINGANKKEPAATTTLAPKHQQSTTSRMQNVVAHPTNQPASTSKPAGDSLASKIQVAAKENLKLSANITVGPVTEASNSSKSIESVTTTTSKPALSTTKLTQATLSPTSASPGKSAHSSEAPKSTIAPKNQNSTAAPDNLHPSTTANPSAQSTMKPQVDPIDELVKKSEKEAKDIEDKVRADQERISNDIKKQQEHLETQSAIKALQVQRSVAPSHGSSASDAKLHQIEHERQMTLDPVGHSLKHQQYEQKKKQKMQAKAAAAANKDKQ